MIQKRCANSECRQSFWTNHPQKRFCSEDCNNWKRKTMPKTQSSRWEAAKAKHDATGVCDFVVDMTTFTGPNRREVQVLRQSDFFGIAKEPHVQDHDYHHDRSCC